MQISRISLMLFAVGSLLLPARIATAQQPARSLVEQIGHRADARRAARHAGDYCAPGDPCFPSSPYGSCESNHHGRGNGWGNSCGCGGNCNCGKHCRCGNGRSCGCGRCGGACGHGCGSCCCHRCLSHLLCKINPYHICTYSPDHGFAPPAQRPIWPAPAAYGRQFPAAWTGEASGVDPSFRHPMIYMPTDTTQLGYYYQLTPYWKARQNMIPPVPHPAEWHTPDFGVEFTGWEDGYGHAAGSCPPGTVISEGVSVNAASPVPMMETNPATPSSTGDSQVAPPPPEDPAPAPAAEAMPELFPVPR